MKEHRGSSAFKSNNRTVVTIGTFDGVHIGHQKIIERLVSTARSGDLESAILTFFPHPRMVLQKDSGIQLINTIDEKKELLEKRGLDHLIVHPFTREFSRLRARDFVRNILVDQLKVRKVIIGYDHRFGRNRTADINDLRIFGKEYDFEVEEISKQDIEEVAVSSTKIRQALLQGDVEKANRYLSYSFPLSGRVVRGRGLGREFGFPTANLEIKENYKLIPKNGVYVVRARIGEELLYGMMNIGTNPTVGGTERTIETHFLDLDKDLYDRFLRIEMLLRIRDEEKFSSVEELKLAIKRDETYTRELIRRNFS